MEKPNSSWTAKLKRREKFCDQFVRQHHPEMADAHKIKGAHPLKPLDGPGYIRDGSGNMEADWWLQTDDPSPPWASSGSRTCSTAATGSTMNG